MRARRLIALGVLALSLVAAQDAPPSAQAPPLELVVAESVSDPVFAILIGSFEAEHFGTLTRERLLATVAELGRGTELPVEQLERLTRSFPEPPLGPRVDLHAVGPVDLPIPFTILGYRPGSILAPRHVVLREWKLGRLLIPGDREADGREPFLIDDTRLWIVEEGEVTIDIDGWLDLLLGAKADDARVDAFALFRIGDERYAVAVGRNPEGANRYGTFDFRENELVFPNPERFKAVGRTLERRVRRFQAAQAFERSSHAREPER